MRRQDFVLLPMLAAVAALPSVTAKAQPGEARGDLLVSIVDSSGVAVAGVRIVLGGRAGYGESDAGGQYRIRGIQAGRVALDLQRLGFQRKTVEVEVFGGRTVETVITMAMAVQPLEPATVSAAVAPRRAARFAEFERRRSSAFGHFLTREEIERRHSVSFTELLRMVPGVRVVTGFGRASIRLRGARCPPHVWIDGTPAGAAEFNLDALPLETVQGVEIYSGISNVPAELMAGRARGRCGVIVVWTRVD